MAHKVICINRRCGSGGHIIGEMVAKELGIKYYDKNLLELALEYGGLDQTKAFENADEKATGISMFVILILMSRASREVAFHLEMSF